METRNRKISASKADSKAKRSKPSSSPAKGKVASSSPAKRKVGKKSPSKNKSRAKTTTPPSSPSKVKLEVAELSPRKGRPPNFTEEEDTVLAKAYVSTSLNPIMGTDQKQEVFWGAVFDRFVELYKTDVEVQDLDVLQKRTWRSLDQRYKKHLQPDVTKWVSVTRNNPIPSGCDEETWLEQLREEFRVKYSRPFKFFDAFLHLRQLPKFDPSTSSPPKGNDDEDSISGGSAYASVASTLKRPQGMKRAKAERREESDFVKIESERNNHLRLLSSSMKTMSENYAQKVQREHHMEMFQCLSKVGMADEAQKHLDAMRSMVRVESKDSEHSEISEEEEKEKIAFDESVADKDEK
jgi:hypothetical protein